MMDDMRICESYALRRPTWDDLQGVVNLIVTADLAECTHNIVGEGSGRPCYEPCTYAPASISFWHPLTLR